MQEWLSHLQAHKRYSPHTINAYKRDLAHLVNLNPDKPLEGFTQDQIRASIAKLRVQGLSPRSIARILAAWRGFFQWWAPESGMAYNPAEQVKAPKVAKKLPTALSVEQAQTLLDHPNLPEASKPDELRDQAMFEVLYSSGLRLSELISLDASYQRSANYESVSWIKLDDSEAHIKGKGNKTRLVPLGSKAIQALEKWLAVRHKLAANAKAPTESDKAALFLGVRGARISPRVVQIQLNKLASMAGLPVSVHPHSLRHSFASHMLQSAQDLRAVQELLGHANISTTQIYTQLDFQHLAQVYDKAHPRANRKNNKN